MNVACGVNERAKTVSMCAHMARVTADLWTHTHKTPIARPSTTPVRSTKHSSVNPQGFGCVCVWWRKTLYTLRLVKRVCVCSLARLSTHAPDWTHTHSLTSHLCSQSVDTYIISYMHAVMTTYTPPEHHHIPCHSTHRRHVRQRRAIQSAQ